MVDCSDSVFTLPPGPISPAGPGHQQHLDLPSVGADGIPFPQLVHRLDELGEARVRLPTFAIVLEREVDGYLCLWDFIKDDIDPTNQRIALVLVDQRKRRYPCAG